MLSYPIDKHMKGFGLSVPLDHTRGLHEAGQHYSAQGRSSFPGANNKQLIWRWMEGFKHCHRCKSQDIILREDSISDANIKFKV